MKKLLIIAAMGALVLTACKEEVKIRELIDVASITIDKNYLELPIGETVQLHATVLPEDAEKPLRWLSSKPDVAIVSEEGAVKAIAPGNASILAVAGNESAVCNILVYRAIETLTLSDTHIEIRRKEKFLIQAEIEPKDATEIIQWSSDKPEIASVDNDGVVTGVSEGEAVITAKTSTLSQECTVVVSEIHAESISISGPTELWLNREATITVTMTPENVTDDILWESSAPETLSVNDGVVKGLAYGEATITASVGELSATMTITVIEVPVESIVLNPNDILFSEIGETVKVTATLLPEDAADKSFSWSIDDPTVASIDDEGNVTALALGATEIHATATNGVIGSAVVRVVLPLSVPYYEDFEDAGSIEANWTFIDADGDDYCWRSNLPDLSTFEAHSGTAVLTSASYINYVGVLTPDNWAFSPPIQLDENGNKLSFWARGQDANYALEHFAAYISTSISTEEVTQLVGETIATGEYTEYTAEIPAEFNGKVAYISFRHFNCSDMYWLNLDDVSVLASSSASPAPKPTYYRAPSRNLPGVNARKIVR